MDTGSSGSANGHLNLGETKIAYVKMPKNELNNWLMVKGGVWRIAATLVDNARVFVILFDLFAKLTTSRDPLADN